MTESKAQARYIQALTNFDILESQIAAAAVQGEVSEELKAEYRQLSAEVESAYRSLSPKERTPVWVLDAR